jgi:uncharacterized protein YukE
VIGWSALGGNPVPGDPLAIRASAARLHSIADKVSQQSRLVQSVAGDGTSSWRGPAATAFRALSNDLDLVLTALVGAHRQAADALSTFAAVLATLQSQAEQLAGQANQAARDYANAHQQVTPLAPQVTAAQTAYNQAAAVPPGPNPNLVGPVADPALSSAYQATRIADGGNPAGDTHDRQGERQKPSAPVGRRPHQPGERGDNERDERFDQPRARRQRGHRRPQGDSQTRHTHDQSQPRSLQHPADPDAWPVPARPAGHRDSRRLPHAPAL